MTGQTLSVFSPETSLPSRDSSVAGRCRSSTLPTAFVAIGAARKIWPRKPSCGPTVVWLSGVKTRPSPRGSSLAANSYRSELRRIPAHMVPLDGIAEPHDPRVPERWLEAEDRNRTVRNAVLALPPKYRDALALFFFHEKDVAATAQCLGLPEGTVKARLSRGREILRTKLPRLMAEPQLEKV